MKTRMTIFRVTFVTVGLLLANTSFAFDMGNVMNPSKWMGGNTNRDRYNDDGGGYGYPGGPGYGYGGPGYAPYYGGAPGYGYGAPPANANATEEIERLQERIRMLEQAARQQQAAPAAPAPNPAWGRSVQPNFSTPAGSQAGGYQYR
jgi:hypothetical protein